MTASEFKSRHPEFEATPDALVDLELANQEGHVSDTWGDQRDQFLALQTARALALSPFGRNARMVNKDGSTSYDVVIYEMKRAHGAMRGRFVSSVSY